MIPLTVQCTLQLNHKGFYSQTSDKITQTTEQIQYIQCVLCLCVCVCLSLCMCMCMCVHTHTLYWRNVKAEMHTKKNRIHLIVSCTLNTSVLRRAWHMYVRCILRREVSTLDTSHIIENTAYIEFSLHL